MKKRRSIVNISYWLPILIVQLYLLSTLLLYRFGPWKYATQSDNRVVYFALLYQFFLFLGYIVALFTYTPPAKNIFKWKQLLSISILINVIMFIPTSYARTGELIPNFIQGIRNPGEAYQNSLEVAQYGISSSIEYLRMFFSPLLYAYLPLGIFFWKHVSKLQIFGIAIVLVQTAALYIAMGTNKALGEFAILIPALIISKFIANRTAINLRALIFFPIVTIVLTTLFFNFFASTMESRSGSGVNIGYFPPGNTRADLYYPVIRQLKPGVKSGILGILNYSTQGYFALGLALDEPFDPMYGLGSSTFLSRQVTRLSGTTAFEDRSYPAKIERYGWDRYVYWSSIYLWIASDLSFYGVAIYCFIMGFILLYCWKDTVEYQLPTSVIMFSLNTIIFAYFSSNNQIGQSGELLFAYAGSFIFWIISRSRFIFKLPGGFTL